MKSQTWTGSSASSISLATQCVPVVFLSHTYPEWRGVHVDDARQVSTSDSDPSQAQSGPKPSPLVAFPDCVSTHRSDYSTFSFCRFDGTGKLPRLVGAYQTYHLTSYPESVSVHQGWVEFIQSWIWFLSPSLFCLNNILFPDFWIQIQLNWIHMVRWENWLLLFSLQNTKLPLMGGWRQGLVVTHVEMHLKEILSLFLTAVYRYEELNKRNILKHPLFLCL